MIREHADELHGAHTLPGDPFDWCGDDEAKSHYHRELDIATAADAAAEAYDALQGERDALLLALLGLVEEKKPLGIQRATYQHALNLIVAIEDREDVCLSDC